MFIDFVHKEYDHAKCEDNNQRKILGEGILGNR